MTNLLPIGADVPQHAKVLPSFLAKLVGRQLNCSTGPVNGVELLAWRGTLPNTFRAKEIREQFIRRKRASFNQIWPLQIGVRAVDGWELAVELLFRDRMRAFLPTLGSLDEFPLLTLEQLKEGLHLPISTLVEALASMEALYWSPSDAQTFAVRYHGKQEAEPAAQARVAVSDEWRLAVQIALRSPWVDQLAPSDLRFACTAGEPLSQWLRGQLAREEVAVAVIDLCNLLVAADKCDWMTELVSLGNCALDRLGKSSPETRERWLAMFTRRFSGPRGLTLQEVGDEFKVTRERVRQICDRMLGAIQSRPASMPALDKVLAAAVRIGPMRFDEADTQLATLLGQGVGVEAAMEFAEAVGRESPGRTFLAVTRTTEGYEKVRLLNTGEQELDWVTRTLSFVRRDCRVVGCTNYMRVAGYLSLKEGRTVDADWLDGLFKALPGYLQLDESGEWFALPGTDECAIATRLRKLFSVATQSIGIDELLAAVASDARMFQEVGNSVSIPPAHVLGKLIPSWPWLVGDGHNKYRPKSPMSREEVLSDLELIAYQILQENQGVVTRTDLAGVIVDQRGFSNVALSLALAHSPIFAKVEHGVYRLNGSQLSVEGLVAARYRRRLETSSTSPQAEVLDTSQPFRIQMRQSGSDVEARRRVVYIPAAFREHVAGQFKHARGLWPDITVSDGLQVRRLSAIAETAGVQLRETFELEVDLQSRTYDIPGATPVTSQVSAGGSQ
ncbi:sigma factor-like helix-turn-helix DNA-binding protein [Acidovorax sp. sic0104]|uniref:sigma factor-like helix-turn-helix DNA-binding protein n=1 Tax=Acidovorax sp. sic0104 TaxID=2854784 RepID=UPI001C46EF34|nr:sigma factor-like helix-turn-helix DNA-binding protein [Acidovorax sp. sic0104]MBV7542008.1 hypothetical protein [Acidovorax sp. sic0104]